MSLNALTRYFLRLGTTGFGGPIALTAAMRRDLVDRRGWITDGEFTEGLALAQLAPGPLAAQLAIYLGWVRYGIMGATFAGMAFVGPSLLMVMGLAAAYTRMDGLPWMRGAFYGIGAAVIAVLIRGITGLARATLKSDPLLWVLALVNGIVVAWTAQEIVWVFVGSGLVALAVRAKRPDALAVVVPFPLLFAADPQAPPTLITILWFFAKAGTVVFGSGLAIVPFLYGGVVQQFHWLNERQFLDAVAVSMITPGPVVITVAFIGYIAAGPLGGLAAAAGVFLPVYLIVVLVAPHFHRLAGNARVAAFVGGVTAAATGTIAGAAWVLGQRAITDATTLAVAAVAVLLLLTLRRRLPEPLLIVAAGVVGVLAA